MILVLVSSTVNMYEMMYSVAAHALDHYKQ